MAKDDAKKTAADTETEPKAAEGAKGKSDAEAKGKAAEEAESTEGLVKVHKDGATMYVHPTTVAAHAAAGWKAV